MQRLNILIWHIHGSYLNTLARIEANWYLPVKEGRPEGYGGRGPTFDLPDYVREVPAEEVRNLQLDLIIFQTPKNYFEDQYQILSESQRQLPKIYLEHNTPKPSAVDTRHPIDDPDVLLVHVTHYNRLMWDNGHTPTMVIEHSVAIDPTITYSGHIQRGITVINGMQKRPRIAGYDLFLAAQEQIPLDAVGMETEALGGLGDVPYRNLHRRVAEYRFLFSPLRYTSLPLAVIEAMTIGMPVVALATTELPTVIENGITGYISCNTDRLLEDMRFLLSNHEQATWMGNNARQIARTRFGLDRFIRDWNNAFTTCLGMKTRMHFTTAGTDDADEKRNRGLADNEVFPTKSVSPCHSERSEESLPCPCHSERSEESPGGGTRRFFASLRMTGASVLHLTDFVGKTSSSAVGAIYRRHRRCIGQSHRLMNQRDTIHHPPQPDVHYQERNTTDGPTNADCVFE